MNILQENISNISQNYYHYLISFKNVKGVGVGYKFINGIRTNELCIHVLVDRKIKKNYISAMSSIPKTYMGIKTDVIEIGNPKILGGKSKIPGKYRPLEGGCGIYTKNATLDGTLGCIAVRKKTLGFNKYYILSNNHVLADSNNIPIGTDIIQPSISDGGSFSNDVVATLSEFVPIKFKKGLSNPKNFADCAIAEVTNKSLISKYVINAGKIKGVSKPILNSHIRKVGFKSGLTDGRIISINTTMNEIEYTSGEKALFADQTIAFLPIVAGDSGSVILNDNNEVIGLLMASGKFGSAIINDINLVLKELNVDIYK